MPHPTTPKLFQPRCTSVIKSHWSFLQFNDIHKKALALSADGQLAVSAFRGGIKVWDVETEHELRMLNAYSPKPAVCIALSADGKLAISTEWKSNYIKVWDVSTGKELRTLRGHYGEVIDIALSADGRLAISGSVDKTLKVWDVSTGKELRTLKEWFRHSGGGVALSADGRLAVAYSYGKAMGDRYIGVWDVEKGRKLRRLKKSSLPMRYLAMNADGQLIISILRSNQLKAWSVVTGQELGMLTGHSAEVVSVAVSADGRLAVSASEDKTIKVWEVSKGRCITTLLVSTALHLCTMSADGKKIVTMDKGGGIHFLELVGSDQIQARYKEEFEASQWWLPRWLKGRLEHKRNSND